MLIRFVLLSIKLYQRYISPFKGFRCAYGVMYGGNSCSKEIYKILETQGLIRGIPLARSQLGKCSVAYKILSSEKAEEDSKKDKKKKPEKKDDNVSWCDLPCYTLDCVPIGRCRDGKGDSPSDCDAPFDCMI